MATEKQHHFSRYICFKPRCLPDDVRYASKRDEFESTMHWEQEHCNLALCVYTTKSNSKGKKNALLLSTMGLSFGVTRDDGKLKPAIIKFYGFTKSGNDALDQKISKYSCESVSRHWLEHGSILFFSIDTIRWNALTLYVIKHGKTIRKTNAFDNRLDLIMSLVKPFIAERPTVGLEIGLRNKISIILGRNADEAVEADCDVEYPRYANESNCGIFVYSISLVWSKRKRNTY